MLEGRIGPGWDVIGARTSDEDYVALRKSLKKRPLDYFKHDFYADTAVFTRASRRPCCRARLLHARQDRVRLRLPVRSGEGHDVYPRDAAILDSLTMPKADREKIYYRNLEAIIGVKLVK